MSRDKDPDTAIEIIPAVLRATFEGLVRDWKTVQSVVNHVQIDISDGVFAGDGTFRILPWLKRLERSEKMELHMMTHNPAFYVDEIIDLSPARCAFHIEAFAETGSVRTVYETLRNKTEAELGLVINPSSPNERLEEHLELLDYVQFMGIAPGWTNQPLVPEVFNKIGAFYGAHPEMPIAVDGHVNKETVEPFVKVGARRLCAATAIFKQGNPVENIEQLKLLARAAWEE